MSVRDLFQPDFALPSQISAPARRDLGELALCDAVLQDAIELVTGGCSGSQAAKREAEFWIWSRDRGPLSFNFVTEILGLDPGKVLDAIRDMKVIRFGPRSHRGRAKRMGDAKRAPHNGARAY